MDSGNPFMWILGFVLIFWVIGGGNGFGFGSNNNAGTALAVDSINTNGYWRENFQALASLGQQANQNTANIADVVVRGNAGLSAQISQGRYDDLLLAYNQEVAKNQALETRVYMDGQFCEIKSQLAQKASIPPFFTAGGYPQFGNCCGC